MNTTRQIFIMWHADPENPDRVIYGNLPSFPLSDKGRQQAKEAGLFLASVRLGITYTSPRERTQQTAQIVAELNTGKPAVVPDERLRDIGLGILQGKIDVQDWKMNRLGYLLRQKTEGGFERPPDIQHRMVEVLKEVVNQHPHENILFVSHGDPIDYLLQWVTQKSFDGAVQYGVGKANIFELNLEEHRVTKIFEPATQ